MSRQPRELPLDLETCPGKVEGGVGRGQCTWAPQAHSWSCPVGKAVGGAEPHCTGIQGHVRSCVFLRRDEWSLRMGEKGSDVHCRWGPAGHGVDSATGRDRGGGHSDWKQVCKWYMGHVAEPTEEECA